VAVDTNGTALTSTNPTGGVAAWKKTQIDDTFRLNGVSCASPTFCVAVDQYGDAVTSTNPTAGTTAWTPDNIDGDGVYGHVGANLNAISCPTITLCVVTDSAGNDVVGTRAASPAISSLSPVRGITGSQVTITGTNLAGATSVKFGTRSASFSVLSAAQIKATVPDGAVPGRVSVTTPAGTATSTATFTPSLSITSLQPASGPYGTKVTIAGVGFTSSPTVRVNGAAASAVTFVSATKLIATVPASATTGKVTVTNTAAPTGTVRSSTSYTVTPHTAPTVSSFTPPSGITGSSVTITGSYFSGATTVRFGSLAAVFSIVSATQIKATVPDGATPGNVAITTAALGHELRADQRFAGRRSDDHRPRLHFWFDREVQYDTGRSDVRVGNPTEGDRTGRRDDRPDSRYEHGVARGHSSEPDELHGQLSAWRITA
jgi:hypothetical protein